MESTIYPGICRTITAYICNDKIFGLEAPQRIKQIFLEVQDQAHYWGGFYSRIQLFRRVGPTANWLHH